MPDPPITLKAAGLNLTSFDALTVQRDLDAFADSFSFTMPSRPEVRDKIKPRGYTPAVVEFGTSRVITGRIELPEASFAESSLTFQGRSLSAQLVDCSMPTERTQWGKLTMGAIARELATPFGLTISLPQGDSVKLGDPIVCADTDTPAAFLQRLAQDTGWLWHSNTVGMPELIRPVAKGAPMAHLVEGLGSFLDFAIGADATQMYSRTRVIKTMGGWDPIKADALDAGIPLFRPRTITGGDGPPDQVQQAANWARARALATAIPMAAEVGDWTTDQGEFWEPGRLITVTCPTCWINRPTPLMIAGVNYRLSSGEGRKATLRLVLPTTYTGELPGAWPWD